MLTLTSTRFAPRLRLRLRLAAMTVAGAGARSANGNRGVATGTKQIRLAVLHQAIEPPVIGGVRKAKKPGGYKDSSADIAYVLHHHSQKNTILPTIPPIQVVTPTRSPNPTTDADWSFPDTEFGILSAITNHSATHIWANTILFSTHPLQTSTALEKHADKVHVVGQPPQLVEKYDDKNWVNEKLRQNGTLRLPRSWTVSLDDFSTSTSTTTTTSGIDSPSLQAHLSTLSLPYPVIGKPIRGRGSHGVRLCPSLETLTSHLTDILSESPSIMIEEFLAGQEGTITVMPPSASRPRHWALPVVERFNHADGVAPYNGVVAVVANSRVVPLADQGYFIDAVDGGLDVVRDPDADVENAYVDVRRQCERVAKLMGATAPIRVDVRRRYDRGGSASDNPFVMFDVNMKPNMTGPGRPSREDQASLTAMAAEGLGWDYARLLEEMLASARPLGEVRRATVPGEWA